MHCSSFESATVTQRTFLSCVVPCGQEPLLQVSGKAWTAASHVRTPPSSPQIPQRGSKYLDKPLSGTLYHYFYVSYSLVFWGYGLWSHSKVVNFEAIVHLKRCFCSMHFLVFVFHENSLQENLLSCVYEMCPWVVQALTGTCSSCGKQTPTTYKQL